MSLSGGQPQLGHVQRQQRQVPGLTAHHCGGGIGAVVGQHNNLEAIGWQGLAVQVGLSGQRRQDGGQVGRLVFGRHDDTDH